MKLPITIKLLFLLVLLAIAPASALDEVLTPDTLKGGQVISVEQASQILKTDAVFYDVRDALNYGRGHIPGAAATPYKGKVAKTADFAPSKGDFDLSRLQSDKKRRMVFYSHGPSGWKSYLAAKAAIAAGYRNVMWLRDGYNEWKEKGFPVNLGQEAGQPH